MAHAGGRPLLFNSVKELQTKIDEYFESCWDYKRDMFGGRIVDKTPIGKNEDGSTKWSSGEFVKEQVKPYTVSGLAVYLGTSRETLMNYSKRAKYFDTIKNAKDKIYAFTEESLFTSKPTGAIFSLKNNYGWVDKQQVEADVKSIDLSNAIDKFIDKL